MLRRASTFFLTFVLMAAPATTGLVFLFCSTDAFAAAAEPSPDFTEKAPIDEANAVDPMVKESVDMAKVPAPPPPALIGVAEYFYRYRHAITLRLGALYDTKSSDGDNLHYLLGVQYLFPTSDLNSYEAGADIITDGTGVAHFARRFIYARTRFRPYTKVGLGVRIVPTDQLATFIKYENFQLRGAAGFEYLFTVFRREINVRLEAEAAASAKSFQGSTTIGSVWAW